MTRSVDEWIGKDDDEAPPPRVRVRVFDAKGGRCHKCTREIFPSRETWTCEHIIAIINGGKNAESNLGLTCCNCLPEKNAEDVAEKSAIYHKRAKHLGIDLRPKWRWGWR
jgi:hypothetical protein